MTNAYLSVPHNIDLDLTVEQRPITDEMATKVLKPWTATPRKRYRLIDAKLIGKEPLPEFYSYTICLP